VIVLDVDENHIASGDLIGVLETGQVGDEGVLDQIAKRACTVGEVGPVLQEPVVDIGSPARTATCLR
jgi:hypothetical protein